MGGNVVAGFMLYNFLKSLPVEITMHNIGSVDSIATVIFMAGGRRLATPYSTFLFHGVQLTVAAKKSYTPNQLRELLNGLEADDARIARAIMQNTKLTEEDVKRLSAQGETMSPNTALEKGVVHKINNWRITDGCPIVNILV